MKYPDCLCLLAIIGAFIVSGSLSADERPNILWITSEDNASFLGCYGDENPQKALSKGSYSSRIVKFLRVGGTIASRPPRGFQR